MTRSRKSKLVKHLTTLFTGCAFATVGGIVHAQTFGDASSFEGELRGSINQDDDAGRTTDNLDLSSTDGQSAQLLGSSADRDENAGDVVTPQQRPGRPVPLPLSPRVQQRAQSVGPAAQVGVSNTSTVTTASSNNAADPVQSGAGVFEEADPFAATGFRLGIFEADLSLEQSIGYSSNVSESADGESGGFSQTEVDLGLTSNWPRHELRFGINGSYRRPYDSDEVDTPQLSANTALRLDLRDGITLTTSGFYNTQTQEFTSTLLAPGAVDTPQTQNYGGSIELQRADRKLQFTLRGEIDRDEFEDASLGGSLFVPQDDLNNTEYGLSLRVGYEVSPAITPFAETRYAVRDFDRATDRNGDQRDSTIYELRGGVEIDMGDKAQGEVAVGYITQEFDDPSLASLDGFTLNGTLNWSPERDTTVGLTLGTETNTSISTGDSGSIVYNAGLTVERQITDRWQVNGNLSYQLETNDDRNTRFEAGIGTQYWLNRYLAFTANGEFVSFSTDAADSDFDAFSIRTGIRLQR